MKRKRIIDYDEDDDDDSDLFNLRKSPDTVFESIFGVPPIIKEEKKDGIGSALKECKELSDRIKKYVKNNELINKKELNDFFSPLVLREHQIVGISWFYLFYNENLNCVLADEMGLGKTIQVIGLLKYLYKTKNNIGPHLIVAPSSTIENWERECNKWFPESVVVVYHGDLNKKYELRRKYNDKSKFNIMIINYTIFEKDQLRNDRKYLKLFHFNYLILDEAHIIRNCDSSRYKVLIFIYYRNY